MTSSTPPPPGPDNGQQPPPSGPAYPSYPVGGVACRPIPRQ